ncbi:nucleotidyltransferase family protein [Spirosoma pollinicola]|uniref:Nucleotidyltransferase n=1 Tax=Spirosoma pollinicola TaxID=2057025 RepID=A0A2K8Z5X9_9BACT|nr:nucleotidyltransferase family protein [Spirosoma pollinicola]AUD05297.1 nucleotidyltransferase [Spirosoma pollinicola]
MITAVQNKQQAFERIQSHQSALKQLGAARLGLFGSFVRNEQQIDSDVDLVVEFEPGQKKLHNFLDMADYLEEVMARKVDLLTWEGMAELVRKHVANEVEYVALTD